MEPADRGYTVRREGDTTTVAYKGAGAGGGYWFGVILFGLIVGGALAAAWGALAFGITMAVMVGLGLLGQAQRSGTGQFSVTDRHFIKGSNAYARSEVTELLVRNRATEKRSDNNSIGNAIVVGAIRKGVEGRSFELCLRMGRKVVVLADNLTEPTANAMLKEVQQLTAISTPAG